jgi:hypothetical protein
MIEQAFQIQREAILQAGGFVNESARFERSEDGGVRFVCDCRADEISVIAPSGCWRTIIATDLMHPTPDRLVESIVALWRYCFPNIESARRFLGARYVNSDIVVPIISWAHHHEDAMPLGREKDKYTLKGSFMQYSKHWREAH